ncbi:hypothetical protein [Geopseudomonas aromaticivorans]
MRKATEAQMVTGIEGRALDMGIKAVLDLNPGVAPQAALAELQALAAQEPNWEEEADHVDSASFTALCPGNPHYLISCIDGYRAEFLDQLQQVRKEAIASLREEGCAVVIFNAGELNGVSARDVESRLVEQGNELIDELEPEPNDYAEGPSL